MSGLSIGFRSLTYELPDGRRVLSDIKGTFSRQRIGLVGDNGVGKSTLLKIIAGEIRPTAGSCIVRGSIGCLPQDFVGQEQATIADVLGVGEMAGEDWALEQRICRLQEDFGLRIGLNRKLGELSGGEQVRINILRLVLQDNDFILLDEPTNNLDREALEHLYRFIGGYAGGVIVVSHDRELLRRVDAIAELFPDELRIYGGNYDFYVEQKNIFRHALEADITTAEVRLQKAKRIALETDERNAKRARTGKIHGAKANLPKIVLGAWKNSAEEARGMSIRKHDRIQAKIHEELSDLRAKRKQENNIKIDLPATRVANSKAVLDVREVDFKYARGPRVFTGFSCGIVGPRRIALKGGNGSGKTTLAKIILGELEPSCGEVRVGVKSVGYLDQFMRRLNPEDTILENMRFVNQTMAESELRTCLARLLFRREDVNKPVGVLSGGERMRVGLAREFLKQEPPQLLILDEPTNNLDINSMERLESALSCYEGALLVISHDRVFLENIDIEDEIRL